MGVEQEVLSKAEYLSEQETTAVMYCRCGHVGSDHGERVYSGTYERRSCLKRGCECDLFSAKLLDTDDVKETGDASLVVALATRDELKYLDDRIEKIQKLLKGFEERLHILRLAREEIRNLVQRHR